jgi:Ser/Thr protein kinase RdoA (MazF antagonist)
VKTPFNESSYLSQVRRLRALARKAMAQYPIRLQAIEFIHHGENATFRIRATNGQSYLLRVHRNDYHTKPALNEEMNWLKHLAKHGISVPSPVVSKRGSLIETVENEDISRNCSVLKWVHGDFVRKSVQPRHAFKIGQLLGEIQSLSPKGKPKGRPYWTAEGLAGSKPKFGSLDNLSAVSPRQQRLITKTRKSVLKKLKQFERKHPDRLGWIHADLHLGNLIWFEDGAAAIDFDDSGYGFFAYDLVVAYVSLRHCLGEKKRHLLPEYKKALIEGYQTKRRWDEEDEAIFPHLFLARRLLMLAWLNSRSDNPRLKKLLKTSVRSVLEDLSSSNLRTHP